MKKRLPLLILLFCSLVSFTFAQGVIKGTVTDKSTGEPLAGSTVTSKNESSGATLGTSTGLDGSYAFKNLKAGAYIIKISYNGYKTEQKTITLSANPIADFALVTSNIMTEAVTVRGTRA